MCFVRKNRSTRVLVPVPWMNAPFFEIAMRFRSGDEACRPGSQSGPETDVAKQTRRWVILYSDKSTTKVEPLTQNLSCLIMQKQVPLGQELLASKVHSHDASMTAICASCLGLRSQSRGVSAISCGTVAHRF